MKIKNKLIISAVAQSIIVVFFLSFTINWVAKDTAKGALEEKAKNQLISLRDTTKNSIESYFGIIQNQAITFSNDQMIIDAMVEFKAAFTQYKRQTNSSTSQSKSRLQDYYNSHFLTEFKNKNAGKSSEASQWLTQLDDDSIVLQDAFISSNQYPSGEKDKLDDLPNRSDYAVLHSKYHDHIRDFQARFGFYDIFLVDAESGDVVYSVFKELDFSTSMIDGPFANTGIGEAFKKANQMKTAEETVLTDFAPYPPSYMDMASFIASPIFDNDGIKVGILIFQMPIDKISSVMTHNSAWKAAGLGESGETYLVGSDHKAKTVSRFLVEDPSGYYDALAKAGVASSMIDGIKTKNSNIGIQTIDTKGVRDGLAGNKGFDIFPGYRNVSVLSAYSPINIVGLNWVVLAEIDEEEAYRAVGLLGDKIGSSALIIGLLALLLASVTSWLLASYIGKLLTKMSDAMQELAVGDGDLTQRLDESSGDELSEIAMWFNRFVEKLQQMMSKLNTVTNQLDSYSRDLSSNANASLQSISDQQNETEQLATAMTEMQATLNEVASNVESAASATQNISKESSIARTATEDNLSASRDLAGLIRETSSVVFNLEQDSDAIGSVLDVIKQIADQTNLLALNAAIEAARAGEQGRGFAVVADEVRTLASRTQTSTEEIQTMIEKLQAATKHSVSSMGKSAEQAEASESLSNKTFDVLSVIDQSITSINDMTTQIATASEEQVAVAEDINRSVIQINELCNDSVEKNNDTAEAANQINHLSIQITELVNQFKI